MASVNKAILIGNVGRDPELRNTTGGSAVCSLSVATTRKWKSQSGEMQEETEWHRVVAYGRTAEIAGEYLAKGRSVYIEGRLQTRKWQDKDGIERYTTEIVAEDLVLLGGGDRNDRGRRGDERSHAREEGGGAARKPQARFSNMDDDIPF